MIFLGLSLLFPTHTLTQLWCHCDFLKIPFLSKFFLTVKPLKLVYYLWIKVHSSNPALKDIHPSNPKHFHLISYYSPTQTFTSVNLLCTVLWSCPAYFAFTSYTSFFLSCKIKFCPVLILPLLWIFVCSLQPYMVSEIYNFYYLPISPITL